MRDCVAGLEFMHIKGYVHADIKSLNFLVTSNLVVKLGDVGETMAIGSEPKEGGDGVIRATTLNWTAPEVLAGQAHRYFPSLDVYSLGLVLFEVLALSVPFNQEPWTRMSHPELIQSIIQGDRPCLPKDVDTKLEQIIRRCWDAKPDARPSATEIYTFMVEYVRELEEKEKGDSSTLQ